MLLLQKKSAATSLQADEGRYTGACLEGGGGDGGTGMAPTPTPSKNVKQCRLIIV